MEEGWHATRSAPFGLKNITSSLYAHSALPQDTKVRLSSLCICLQAARVRGQLPQIHYFSLSLFPVCFFFSWYLSHSLNTECPPTPAFIPSPSSPHLSSLNSPLFQWSTQCQPQAPFSRHLQGLHQRQRLSMHLSLSLYISLLFCLLRIADYCSLHGLSGADRRLSWRERLRMSGGEDPASPP